MKKGWGLLVLVAGLPGLLYAQYSFELVCRSDTFQRVEPNGVGFFYFTLTNTGTRTDVYELNCTVLSIVPDWSVIYCLRGRCVEPGIPMYDTLASGEADTTIDIAVYTTGTLGEARVVLHVRSLGNPALTRSITTITNNVCAIGEDGRSGEIPVFSRLIGANQALNIEERPAQLFDISGRTVMQLTPGRHRLSSLPGGSYLLNYNQRWYKLVLLH